MLRTNNPRDIETWAREPLTWPKVLAEYAVAKLPDPVRWKNGLIIVPDETGGATLAFSDGTNWLRATDLATVS